MQQFLYKQDLQQKFSILYLELIEIHCSSLCKIELLTSLHVTICQDFECNCFLLRQKLNKFSCIEDSFIAI